MKKYSILKMQSGDTVAYIEHESIRPTLIIYPPEGKARFLTGEEAEERLKYYLEIIERSRRYKKLS